jgi:hypothetical protein
MSDGVRRSWSAALVVVVLALAARTAAACGQAPPGYWTWGTSAPVPAEGLPLDGAMLLTGVTWGESGQPSEIATPGTHEITVRDAAGALVPGQTTPWLFYVVWRPTSPLPPATEFTLEAVSTSAIPRPPGIAGEPTLQRKFRSGDRAAPPLQLSGALQIALETHDLDVHTGCNNCGTGCTVARQVRALRARVSLPITTGGQSSVGYSANLWLTNDQPRQPPLQPGGTLVSLGVWRVVLPDQPAEALIAIPEEERPYAPCFSLQVTDPAGHSVVAPPVCLPSMDVTRKIHELDGTSDGGGGCNVTQAPPRVPALTLAALALLLAAMLRRRS